MPELRYKCEDRFAETQGYDGFEADREELKSIYQRIKPIWEDHNNVGVDDDQLLYHISYDDNMELWDEIFQVVRRIGEGCGVKIVWEEVKHVMKFTFMWTKPHGKLMPHTAHNLRALSAFNIPLIGKTEIILYHRKREKNLMFPGSDTYEYARHEYFNPCFLNVNKLHGLVNDSDQERVILKTHMLITPIETMIEATEGDKEILQLPYAPWLESKFKQKLYLAKAGT
jgi:hypothetical protein